MKWKVQIPTGLWMAGVHTFRTKKLAVAFVQRWQEVDFNMRGRILALKLWKEPSANF